VAILTLNRPPLNLFTLERGIKYDAVFKVFVYALKLIETNLFCQYFICQIFQLAFVQLFICFIICFFVVTLCFYNDKTF